MNDSIHNPESIDVYFLSTPLNIFLAMMHMVTNSQKRKCVFLIDQYKDSANKNAKILKAFIKDKDLLIVSVTRGVGGNKNKQLRKVMDAIHGLIDKESVSSVIMCNDRRVESQYALRLCKKKDPTVKGVYLDDGLFTYLGWMRGVWLKRYVLKWFKSIGLGWLWDEPVHIGTSKYIDEVLLMKPCLAGSRYADKIMRQISIGDKEKKSLSKVYLSTGSISDSVLNSISGASYLLSLPNKRFWGDGNLFSSATKTLVHKVVESQDGILIKYHPNEHGRDLLGLVEEGGVLIPDGLAYEALLFFLPEKMTLISGMSTTILTTALLRPDVRIFVLDDGRDLVPGYRRLMDDLNIQMISIGSVSSIVGAK